MTLAQLLSDLRWAREYDWGEGATAHLLPDNGATLVELGWAVRNIWAAGSFLHLTWDGIYVEAETRNIPAEMLTPPMHPSRYVDYSSLSRTD